MNFAAMKSIRDGIYDVMNNFAQRYAAHLVESKGMNALEAAKMAAEAYNLLADCFGKDAERLAAKRQS